MNSNNDFSNLKFVLYARKSTEEDNRQINSIEDQIRLCKDYANRNELNIVEIIEEKKSAKYSGKRDKFNKMIKDVRKGVYDGILAYHPDRLSRNMLEAGLIIDMLTPDEKGNEPFLKALLFQSVSYSNDSGGRLTLAVLFSLATQYSEHLSEVVKRGTDSNLNKGISNGQPKWGYNRNNYGRYEPNKDFDLVRKGWDMILSGTTQREVADFWKKQRLSRQTKVNRRNKKSRSIGINKNTVSKILKDPFYYGVLCQNEQEVDLRTVPGYDFKPMVTEEEFNKVQARLYESKAKKRNTSKSKTFLPLRGMVHCAECGSLMYASVSKGKRGDRYGYYACQNKACQRKHKNVRFKEVFEQLYEVVSSLKADKKAYDEYIRELNNYADTEIREIKEERRSQNGALSQIKTKQKELNQQYADLYSDKNTPSSVLDGIRMQIEELQDERIDLENKIKELDRIIKNPDLIKLNLKDSRTYLKWLKIR